MVTIYCKEVLTAGPFYQKAYTANVSHVPQTLSTVSAVIIDADVHADKLKVKSILQCNAVQLLSYVVMVHIMLKCIYCQRHLRKKKNT